jgi:hypothetical protein
MATNDQRLRRPTMARVDRTDEDRSRLVRTLTLAVGVVFLAVGILGFVPGITTHVDDMRFAGHESPSELFGVFQVSVLHNLVHLLFGVVGIAAARTVRTARPYLLIGGAVYLLLWIYGLAVDHEDTANFVPVDDADNWLHLGLGLGMIAFGLIPTSRHEPADRSTTGAR